MAFSEDARRQIRTAKAWAGGLVEEDVPMSTAVIAMLRVAREHPDSVRAEIAKAAAEAQE